MDSVLPVSILFFSLFPFLSLYGVVLFNSPFSIYFLRFPFLFLLLYEVLFQFYSRFLIFLIFFPFFFKMVLFYSVPPFRSIFPLFPFLFFYMMSCSYSIPPFRSIFHFSILSEVVRRFFALFFPFFFNRWCCFPVQFILFDLFSPLFLFPF